MSPQSATYLEHNLMSGERLIASARIHSAVVTVPAFLFAVACVLLLVGLVMGQNGVLLAFLGGILATLLGPVTLANMIVRATTEFGLTDKRVIVKSGWLTTQVREMPLGKVETIRVKQGIVGKIFGFGTLVAVGSGGTRRACATIAEPFDFYRRVQEQVARVQKNA
jgi:uncharacterized membrane protein YdbT with pleckstrin-like domain